MMLGSLLQQHGLGVSSRTKGHGMSRKYGYRAVESNNRLLPMQSPPFPFQKAFVSRQKPNSVGYE